MANDECQLPLSGGQAQVPMQRCRICWELKRFEEFERRGRGRRPTRCKACVNAARDPIKNRRRVKEWRQANPERWAARGRRQHESRRGDPARWLRQNLRAVRASCKKRGIECTIAAEELLDLHVLQEGRCALTGRVMLYGSKGTARDSASMDRRDQTKGYISGNVRLVTYQANMARGMFSDEELYALCEAVLTTRDAVAEAAE